MYRTALICARGGSKGLPGKNIRPLAGKPLIVRAIEQAKAVSRINRVLVSTDSREIADLALSAGGVVPFLRPVDLARDDSPEWLVWRHALGYLRESEGRYPDVLMVIPTTAPLRHIADLDRCLDTYERGGTDAVITVTDSHRSPYFNMVKLNTDGTVELVIPPASQVFRRQDAPPVYDITTVAYVVRPDLVMRQKGIFDGVVRSVFVPVERALDIDTLLDFRIAEALMANGFTGV